MFWLAAHFARMSHFDHLAHLLSLFIQLSFCSSTSIYLLCPPVFSPRCLSSSPSSCLFVSVIYLCQVQLSRGCWLQQELQQVFPLHRELDASSRFQIWYFSRVLTQLSLIQGTAASIQYVQHMNKNWALLILLGICQDNMF